MGIFFFIIEDIKAQLDEMGYIWECKLADGSMLSNEELDKILNEQLDLEVALKINQKSKGKKTFHIDNLNFYSVEDGPSGSGESRPAYRYKGLDYTRQWRERLIKKYAFDYFEICKACLNVEIETLQRKNSIDAGKIKALNNKITTRNETIDDFKKQISDIKEQVEDLPEA